MTGLTHKLENWYVFLDIEDIHCFKMNSVEYFIVSWYKISFSAWISPQN